MKKIFGITIAMMLGLSMIGCEDTMSETELEEPKKEIEQQVEVEEKEIQEDKVVEEPEEEVEVFDEEKFNYYMTTSLTDEEYNEYFNSIIWTKDGNLREIEFDGHILMVTPHEKYNTRCELLLASGDYNNGNFVGPYIKTKDIGYTQLNGMINEGYNVRVKATIEEYDMDAGYLVISIKAIEQR